MQTLHAPTLQRFLRIADHAALLGVLFTAAATLGRFHWGCELFTHFQPQLALCFIGYALLQFALREKARAAVALIFAVKNALPAVLLLLPPATTPAATPAHHLRILQANILTSNTNASALLALVARENPDIIILQEPNARWLSDLAPLSRAYPVSATDPREDNFGAAIFAKSARSAEIIHLNDPERAPSTRALIDVSGRTLTVIGTHPPAPYCASKWRGRNAYTLGLARLLSETQGPRVVTGDFNNTPWSSHFQAFMTISGLRDSAQGRRPQPTWPTFLPAPLRIPLDHCFHSADVRIIDRRLGPDIGSDHLPLIIDLAFD
ncbi:MAG: endonuclease/exonuclease/phosphatase family protein [Verrucomicrobiota bacterium]|jgi:endonuclease/exonuclease/phosphatase (EEP) superfamily protein YafD|nr:endonuclease/exonuclease/phosphatase family protein [Verrucomicrobiota bacterium]